MQSGPQGVSGESVRIGKMISDKGKQTITSSGVVDIDEINNAGHKPRTLPFSKVKSFTLLHIGLSWIDSFLGSAFGYFKK